MVIRLVLWCCLMSILITHELNGQNKDGYLHLFYSNFIHASDQSLESVLIPINKDTVIVASKTEYGTVGLKVVKTKISKKRYKITFITYMNYNNSPWRETGYWTHYWTPKELSSLSYSYFNLNRVEIYFSFRHFRKKGKVLELVPYN